jgi:hypothetical protein
MALIPGTLPTGTKYPSDPQSLLDTFASYLTAPEAKKNRPTVTEVNPVSGGSSSFNAGGQDETLFLNNSSTIAAYTVNLPTLATSAVGQTLRIFARSQVTDITVDSNGTIYAAAFGSPEIAAGQTVVYQKVSGTVWARIQ